MYMYLSDRSDKLKRRTYHDDQSFDHVLYLELYVEVNVSWYTPCTLRTLCTWRVCGIRPLIIAAQEWSLNVWWDGMWAHNGSAIYSKTLTK